ncbi:hypothetical protein SNEBB_006086 [Seison nebaliae]|nr:hypothetical protein SNEBB_006086 [Seison nebaliae]
MSIKYQDIERFLELADDSNHTCKLCKKILKSPKKSSFVSHFKRKHGGEIEEKLANKENRVVEKSNISEAVVRMLIKKNANFSAGEKLLTPFLQILKNFTNNFEDMNVAQELHLSRRSVKVCLNAIK